MGRNVYELANTLKGLYQETFKGQDCEPYRMSWVDLRMLAGVNKVTNALIAEINEALTDEDYTLTPFNDYIVFSKEEDWHRLRKLPGRFLESCLPDAPGDGPADDAVEVSDDDDDTDDFPE